MSKNFEYVELRDNCASGKYNSEMLLKACKGFEFIEQWILLSVTKNLSYDRLEYSELGRIPVSRTSFYRYKKLFYSNLNALEEKKMKQYKFSTEEIKKLCKKMIVLVDSREKENNHILSYLNKQKIAYRKTKLDYGDYSFYIPATAAGEDIYFHDSIVTERKASLEELSGNLTQDRTRFETEFLKAGNNGTKTYLMIEDAGGYSSIISHKYSTQFTPISYMASLKAWEARFNCNTQFIEKQYSGYYIYSTFYYFCREALK